MSQRHLHILAATLVALALAGCESTEQKRPAPVPVRATAPTVAPTPAPPPTPAPKPVEVQAPRPDPVAELVNEVERQYQAGQAAYAAGHLEAAKDAFNRAFDRLLQSPMGVHSDPRLEKEFDKVVAGVHALEMQALKQGDGFTEQKTLPAPID